MSVGGRRGDRGEARNVGRRRRREEDTVVDIVVRVSVDPKRTLVNR